MRNVQHEQEMHWASVTEFARHYRVARTTVYRMLVEGLPAVKIGRIMRIDMVLAKKWLQAQQAQHIQGKFVQLVD